MVDDELIIDSEPIKKPRIVNLGKSENFLKPLDLKKRPRDFRYINGNEIDINPLDWDFEPNQNASIFTLEDGSLEVSVNQEGSTPGIRSKSPILLQPGIYVLTVVGFSESESTFFPWVIDDERVRLTPTIHISTFEEPISVQFRVEKEIDVFFGVLSHRQEIGDKCYIRSFHISKSNEEKAQRSEKQTMSNLIHRLVPHQNTTLTGSDEGIIVTSKPISTPGSFALVDVRPDSTITIFVRATVSYPSTAFLYVADSTTGSEIIKRNTIFDSDIDNEEGKPSELYSSIKIPIDVSQIRIGLLFSTVTQPEQHSMIIHRIEVAEYKRIDDIVDESYVINMRGEEEKLVFCRKQADRFDFSISPWEATDGNSEPNIENWRNYMDKPWTDIDKKLSRKAIDKPGAWGYLLSMRGIFLDAISKKHDSIAIFDDDFVLANSFDHRFSRLIENIGDGWDVIYLGASQWLWQNSTNLEGPCYYPDENTNGTFAVMYKNTVFRQIIDEIDKMEAPFDAGPLRNIVLGNSTGKSFVSYPNLAIANIEKPGIRESRNQIEFSKRFDWNLEDFPSWFSSWSPTPIVIRESTLEFSERKKPVFVTAVTTINRLEYLKSFVSTWLETKSPDAESVLIVADDGSTDGTVEWLTEDLDAGDSGLQVIRNNGSGIARQSNSILDAIVDFDFPIDAVFMCNDDIRFRKNGWDDAYYSAMQSSGFDHLVYFNPEWKPASHTENSTRSESLISHCNARGAMGCFYTLTPELIEKLGFFDEDSFPVRGHSHVDYTIRACRAEANDTQFLFDLIDSNEYISMVLRDGYKRTFRTLSVKEMKQTTSNEALSIRESILLSEDRIYVPRGW
tara:strand:+ start:7854 stop:10391 length:2538 start_codon:yes stop_codon:yes gene_type:complete